MSTVTSPPTALILLDLQSDFLKPTGALKRCVPISSLQPQLAILVHAAREAGHAMIWVKSHYPELSTRPEPLRPTRHEAHSGVPMNSDMLAGSHVGRPRCVADSPGAAYPPEMKALQHDDDHHLLKSRYSAFGDTELHTLLASLQIRDVFVAGVLTNESVRATTADAFFLGFNVTVVSDCVATTRANLHREALAAIQKHYARVEPYVLALTRWKSVRHGLGAGDTSVWYGAFNEPALFERVRDEVNWEEMHHRGGVVPRKVSLQGDICASGDSPMYRHPADEQPVLRAWTPEVKSLAQKSAQLLGQRLNHVLIQRYMDGRGYISPHSDKTLDIERGTDIVGLSLGATRTMVLQHKTGKSPTQHLELPHGSLFVLGWRSNQEFQHGIRQDRRAPQDKRSDETIHDSQRISLTMRSVATFMTPKGDLYGQGALRKAPHDPLPEGRGDARAEAERLLKAFGQENMSDTFAWDLAYGSGFDILDFHALRGEEE